jgi:hypothetical protein
MVERPDRHSPWTHLRAAKGDANPLSMSTMPRPDIDADQAATNISCIEWR